MGAASAATHSPHLPLGLKKGSNFFQEGRQISKKYDILYFIMNELIPSAQAVSPPAPASQQVFHPVIDQKFNSQSVDKNMVFVKIAIFFFIVGFYVIGFAIAYKTFILKSASSHQTKDNQILLQAPLRMANWEDIGRVSDPVLELPVKTAAGFKKIEFLLDSGAVISSLPREMAQEMGLDLAFLKRIAFVGYGGSETFSYKGKMTVLLGEKETELPVVFTQGYYTRSLLGRQGFFDEYIITFDKKRGVVEIKI